MIAKLAGLAIDARFATAGAARAPGPVAQARAARWIAANALAARGIRLAFDGTPPREACAFALRAESLTAVLAAIAAVPVLVDARSLPCAWRLALRALGLPTLDRPAAAALAAGASVLSAGGAGLCELAVACESHGFRVHLGSSERTLVA